MYMQEFLRGFGSLIAYFLAAVIVALLLRKNITMHKEVFRKLLHLILLLSLPVTVYAFDTWWLSALTPLIFAVLALPILLAAERIEGFSKLLVERKKHEIVHSLILAFGMFSLMIALCWGLFGERLLVFACIYAWGFGDAAAALVGKRFGKKKLNGPMIEGTKSAEGTMAMFLVSFASVMLILLIRGDLSPTACLVISLLTAAVSALVELFTKNGNDTITCPLAAAATILPLLHAWGSISL